MTTRHGAAGASTPLSAPAAAHWGKIDGLRFVAILLVLIEHFADEVGHLISAGYFGVDLFFVISGFLVTGILLRSNHSFGRSYLNFVGRRTLRIFPVYYATLAVLLLVGYGPAWESILWLATYTYNWAWIRYQIPTSWLSHFWSLALEEQFYLLWPPIVLALRRFPRTLAVGTLALAVLCYFQLVTEHFEVVNDHNFTGLFPRAGSLLVGALGAMAFHHGKLSDNLFRKNILVEWLVFGVLGITLATSYPLKFPVLALCSLYLVLKSVHSDFHLGPVNRILDNPRVRWIGTISYGIYLFHPLVGNLITTWFIMPWWYAIDFEALGAFSFLRHCLFVAILPLYGALSIGLAALSSRYFERPILALKDRWFR